jgi:rhodanese-related sulfurtransferase
VALQLMKAGFTRVSVVRGGFPAMLTAGVSVAPKEAICATAPAHSSA